MVTKNGRKTPPPKKGGEPRKRKQLPADVPVTPVFVRRSSRKTADAIAVICFRFSHFCFMLAFQRERLACIVSMLSNTAEHEKCLKVQEFPGKGRGVRTLKEFSKVVYMHI